MSKPQIGVNLCWLVPGVVGGSEEYTMRLLSAVADSGQTDFSLRVYAQPDTLAAYPDLNEMYETVKAPTLVGGKATRISLESSWLALQSSRDAVVHHGGGVVPPVRSAPAIVTIHDLQPIEMPQHFSAVKRSYLGRMIPYSVRVARAIFCPSAFTAQSLERNFEAASQKIKVIPHGYEVSAAPQEPAVFDQKPFLLYPAIAYPHKRHVDLVEALALLTGKLSQLTVVFTGGDGPERSKVEERSVELGVADRVSWLGRVSADKLNQLYSSAFAMVMPSEYEGFGNPLLEAMSSGCPVVASNAASIPEVVGDAAILTTPRQPAEIAAAVERLSAEPALRDSLVEQGIIRSRLFAWEKAGDALIEAYRHVLEDPVGRLDSF